MLWLNVTTIFNLRNYLVVIYWYFILLLFVFWSRFIKFVFKFILSFLFSWFVLYLLFSGCINLFNFAILISVIGFIKFIIFVILLFIISVLYYFNNILILFRMLIVSTIIIIVILYSVLCRCRLRFNLWVNYFILVLFCILLLVLYITSVERPFFIFLYEIIGVLIFIWLILHGLLYMKEVLIIIIIWCLLFLSRFNALIWFTIFVCGRPPGGWLISRLWSEPCGA